MADLRISQLPPLGEAALQADDVVAIVDLSASETKKITAKDLIQGSVALIDAGSIPGDKVTVTLPEGSVGTFELADGGVTAIKLADNSTAIIQDPLPATGQYIGQLGLTSGSPYIWNGSTWVAFPTGILNIVGGTVGAITTDVTIDGASANVLAKVDDSTVPAAFLAGPTASGGEVNLRSIVPDDLPFATETTPGIVTVPQGGGLGLDGGVSGLEANLVIDNTIPPSTTNHLVTYTEKGLVSGGREIQGSDLPTATSGSVGAISAGPDFSVTADGQLNLANNVTGATYPVITYNNSGLVVAGRDLEESDIPELNATKITSGQFTTEYIADDAVTSEQLSDYATCLMQEDNPGAGDFLGQFWYTPSTAQLRVYSRGSGPQNIWLPVGFGALQANNLRWGGTYNADTDTLVSLTSIAVSEGLTAGQVFPNPSDALSGIYFVCQVEGNSMTQPNINGISHTAGDWALCLDATQGWVHIDANGGGGGGGGAQYLNDLVDVTIGGTGTPFETSPRMSLTNQNILKYDSGAGQWRNTDVINGGTF